MSKLLLGLCIILIFIIATYNSNAIKHHFKNDKSVYPSKNNASSAIILKLKKHIDIAKKFAGTHRFNDSIAFLIDMKIPSGKKRFFLVDFKKDTVTNAGLVTHGSGSYYGADSLIFSNVPQSSCTSLGMYKIGASYQGSFGLAYKLYGLSTTNSKAFERFVVLHSHDCVPPNEVYPQPICQSLGCPTVAPAFLAKLQPIIDASPKPILLYIYY
jgi:hypothetical protein